MSYYRFEANRISGDGNALFPDVIIIDDEEEVVIYRKGKILGYNEVKIRFGAIASVSRSKHVLITDIYIETRGGREIVACGFNHYDANRIIELLSF